MTAARNKSQSISTGAVRKNSFESQQQQFPSGRSNGIDGSTATTTLDVDKPFTKQEKIQYTVYAIIVPWCIWFPLFYVGGFLASYPSQPSFPGLWVAPTVLTAVFLIGWIRTMDRPRIIRMRAALSVRGGKPMNVPEGEKFAGKILSGAFLALCFISTYEASSRYNPINHRPADMTAKELPSSVYVIGSMMMFVSWMMATSVFRENVYAIKVVCEQKDQKLITTGPYSIVRHPLYGFLFPFFIGLPLVIGSYYGIIPGALFMFGLMYRTYPEEKFLTDKFGNQYLEYQQKVRYRMFPGIF